MKALLKDVVYAPDMAFMLVSISRFNHANCSVSFSKGMCMIKDPAGHTMVKIPWSNELCWLDQLGSTSLDYANIASGKMSISKAHCKLGHIAHAAIKYVVSNGFITGINLDLWSKLEIYKVCVKAKSAHQPFPKESLIWATKYGEQVHWDLWGPASVKNINGHYYVATQIDDVTWEIMLYFQEKRSEALKSYKKDEVLIETQTGNHIKIMCSDQGGEFLSKELIKHHDEKGMIWELTVHDSLPQNGTAERGMCTHAKKAWALLLASGLPNFLWDKAMKHTTWLQNRTPACALNGKAPYEQKNNKKPHLAGIQEFGATTYVKDMWAGKLEAQVQVGHFIGYNSELKGYRIYWTNKRSIMVEQNVVFNNTDRTHLDDHAVMHWPRGRGTKSSRTQLWISA